jgi:hypothetical protein
MGATRKNQASLPRNNDIPLKGIFVAPAAWQEVEKYLEQIEIHAVLFVTVDKKALICV